MRKPMHKLDTRLDTKEALAVLKFNTATRVETSKEGAAARQRSDNRKIEGRMRTRFDNFGTSVKRFGQARTSASHGGDDGNAIRTNG